jgi:aspartate aminotransferase-like enzyme
MKLLIPGPVNVEQKYSNLMSMPMISHRSSEFELIHYRIINSIKELFETNNDVFLITASASGAMEAAIRNCVNKNVLCIANGDFGRRWHEIATMNGKDSTLIDFNDATVYDYNQIRNALKIKSYDAITIVLNETTCGIENHLEPIKKILQEYPNTLLLVDAVTAAFGTQINLQNIDVLLFGTQKALALPPGMSITIANQSAINRAQEVKNRGYYFDYILMKKNADKNFTVTTPNISLMYALKSKLEDIKLEGMNNYIMEHHELSQLVRSEIKKLGFELLIEDKYASNTVTVIKNNLNINIKQLQEEMRKAGFELANGYGKLKDITFRFGHMGLDRETTLKAIAIIKIFVESKKQ